jgi:DNA-binding MarR family transcriptional regulator
MKKYSPLARGNFIYTVYRADGNNIFGVMHSTEICERLSISKSTLTRLYKKTDKSIKCKCGNVK